MIVYKNLLFPLLSRFDAEEIHNLTVWLLELAQRRKIGRAVLTRNAGTRSEKPFDLFGLTFPNPIGIGAGFDKDARIPDALALLGFGHIEVGTLTPFPQAGNEKPRLFRLREDGALINRMGFPNRGAASAIMRLEARREIGRDYILGVSIGKQSSTPLEQAFNDYALIMTQAYHVADYFAINVSSPNTPGLRELQGPRYLRNLLASIREANKELAKRNKRSPKPVLLKISPDLSESEIDLLLDTALSGGINGIIATNTTSEREHLIGSSKRQIGGLSGRPLAEKSNRIISYIHEVTRGDLPIIGAGGVFNGDDVRRKMDAGASLVQLYTGLIYEGPSIVSNILRDL
ncbi:MAG: quinone-dependent dihydroorotate dehydrogenase [Anaerolineae bacterium]|nr:MAG: quinone-dependent dihydroorotate dehydrogenase [Anaerolineae bacterium]